MKIITLSNMSGGCSKTTTCQAIIEILRKKGFRVLGIDLDLQSSLTGCMNMEGNKYNAYDFLSGTPIQKVIENDFISSSRQLARAENLSLTRLKEELHRIKNQYDFVIIDTPPSTSKINMMCFVASDYVIIPTQMNKKGYEGIQAIIKDVEIKNKTDNPGLKILGVLLTRFNQRQGIAQYMEEQIQETGLFVFKARIRQTLAIEECQLFGDPITSKTNKAVYDYRMFVNEMLERIENGKS